MGPALKALLYSIKIQELQYDGNLTRNISSSVTAKIRSSLPVNRFISFWTAFVSIRTYTYNYMVCKKLYFWHCKLLSIKFTTAQATYTENVLSSTARNTKYCWYACHFHYLTLQFVRQIKGIIIRKSSIRPNESSLLNNSTHCCMIHLLCY